MTCADLHCKNQWHKKKCAEWNRKNTDYFKSNYLQKKIDTSIDADSTSQRSIIVLKSRLKSGLPLQFVQEVIGIQHLLILEYLAQLLERRFQEVIRA